MKYNKLVLINPLLFRLVKEVYYTVPLFYLYSATRRDNNILIDVLGKKQIAKPKYYYKGLENFLTLSYFRITADMYISLVCKKYFPQGGVELYE